MTVEIPVVSPPVGAATARTGGLGTLAWLLSGLAVAAAVVGASVHAPGRLTPTQACALAVALVWAAVGPVAFGRLGRRVSPHPVPRLLISAGALGAAVTVAATRWAGVDGPHRALARSLTALVGLLTVAVVWHFVLALPLGRLTSPTRQGVVLVGYGAALAAGAVLAAEGREVAAGSVAVAALVVVVVALPALRARYLTSTGRDRERLQWLAVGAVAAADAAVLMAVLHVLVEWPGPLAAVVVGATVAVPLCLVAADAEGLAPSGGRVLVQVLAVAGFSALVSATYVVVVLGLGHAPTSADDRQVLGLSMVAAAVAAVAYLPARARLTAWATRFVYGSRQAPDEVVRTFGSRLTRAIPMDELLLQLAESLRKTLALSVAEVYTGRGEVLDRAVSVPDLGSRSLVVSERERPVVTRAGVSGNAWASVWLPALLDGRRDAQVRVAPVSHAGELLGLIVVERPAQADHFSDEDDRVLTELARQVGLALHNSQLDSALQTSLAELRRQAQELRESRARIVASGDAERRRVERNLHDGAQQHLVALAVNLRLARDVLASDPAAAAEMLDQLTGQVHDTIAELRELAHGIYPPLLVDSGLGEALRAAANRNPLEVAVTVDGIGRYPAEVEAATYFCCLEALQNAAKHAPGASVEVRVWEDSGGLLFAVTDDGPGFDPAVARRGHGYVNMADRLGAIGGSVRWESRPGQGARVEGSIPLA